TGTRSWGRPHSGCTDMNSTMSFVQTLWALRGLRTGGAALTGFGDCFRLAECMMRMPGQTASCLAIAQSAGRQCRGSNGSAFRLKSGGTADHALVAGDMRRTITIMRKLNISPAMRRVFEDVLGELTPDPVRLAEHRRRVRQRKEREAVAAALLGHAPTEAAAI